MSSPSQVQIIAVPEANYGVTVPLAGAVALTARFTSESLSGTPTTVESAELRSDRMPGGQILTGLESGGDLNFELSKDALYDRWMALALMSSWVPGASLAAAPLTLDRTVPENKQATITITGDTGNFGGVRPLVVGDVLITEGFANPANNTIIQVVSITDATHFVAWVPADLVDEVAALGVLQLADYVDIGNVVGSDTVSKSYLDVVHNPTTNEHSQRYAGSIINRLSVTAEYGRIITGVFGLLANGYIQEAPSLRQQIITAGGDVTPAGTAQPLNGSVDLNMIMIDATPTDFCIQSITVDLNNNATPQQCLGQIAPSKYNLGTVTISVNMSVYLGDAAYDRFMPAKLSQAPIGVLFGAGNADGGYAFSLRAVQLSFPDPSASGGNSPVLIEATGTAKVGTFGESAIRIWRW